MLYAVKDNKSYQVGEDKKQQADFLARGYDIVDDSGRTVQHSPVKAVPYAKYAKLLEENERLRSELKTMLPPESEAEAGIGSPVRTPRKK